MGLVAQSSGLKYHNVNMITSQDSFQATATTKRERFLQIYANLPLATRNEIIYVTEEDKPLSWNVAYIEVRNDTPTGRELLEELERLQII